MTITIDGPKALKLLRGAVKLKGEDYTDPLAASGEGCKYVVGGAPSCIVGHAIAAIKPGILPLIEVWERTENDEDRYNEEEDEFRPTTLEEGHPGDTDSSSLLQSIRASHVGVEFTDEAERICAVAQGIQDGGKTWGEALKKAKGEAGE